MILFVFYTYISINFIYVYILEKAEKPIYASTLHNIINLIVKHLIPIKPN